MNPSSEKDRREYTDSEGSILIVLEKGGDPTVRPMDPKRREELERRMRRWQMLREQFPTDATKPEDKPPSPADAPKPEDNPPSP